MLRVKQIREEKRISKYRVCKDSGVAYTSYNAIEKRMRRKSIYAL